jgi:hypothetical protein
VSRVRCGASLGEVVLRTMKIGEGKAIRASGPAAGKQAPLRPDKGAWPEHHPCWVMAGCMPWPIPLRGLALPSESWLPR